MELATSNPFGRINGAVLTTCGKLIPIPPSVVHVSKAHTINPCWDIMVAEKSAFSCELDWLSEEMEVQPPDGFIMLRLANYMAWNEQTSCMEKGDLWASAVSN